MRVAEERGNLNTVLGEPEDGIRDGGEEGVHTEKNAGFLVESGELRLPERAELRFSELIEPIRNRLADGAWLLRKFLLASKDLRGREAFVFVPFGKLVTHQQPLRGEQGVCFLGIDKERECAAPTGRFKKALGDEITVPLAPFRIRLKGGGELVVEDAVVDQDGLGDLECGGAEVAMEFHKVSNLKKQLPRKNG